MPLQVKCPNPDCGSVAAIDDKLVGANTYCNSCGMAFHVTAPPTIAPRPAPSTILPVPASNQTQDGGVSPSASAKPPAASGPPQRIGRFEIRARLGAGAFGVVYRAYDPQLQREVALKVLHPEMLNHPDRVARFQREARSAAQLRHANIVPVFDIGQDGSQYYIASAYIPGQTLHDALDNKRMSFQRAARIVRDLADAVGYAHQQGVVHRDLKPANILLDEKDSPQLVDFGLSARQETEPQEKANRLTRLGAVIGTPAYMAPEQARGQTGELQPSADQYSMGVILYELLCGQPPFEGPPALVLYKVMDTTPATPRSLNSTVPSELERICLKAMAPRPEDRYADCQALADALRRWVERPPAIPVPAVADQEEPRAIWGDLTHQVKRSGSQVRPLTKSMDRRWLVWTMLGIAVPVLVVAAIVGVILVSILWNKDRNQSASNPMANLAKQPGDTVVKDQPKTLTVELGGGVKMEFVLIPKGKFLMGSPKDEMDRGFDEEQHEVEITKAFYLAKYPVTQEQYQALMKANLSWFEAAGNGAAKVAGMDTKQFPVENVSWYDAKAFCMKMHNNDQLKRRFRLPTEAEWEYACRAGTTTPFYFSSQLNGREANCDGNNPYGTTDKGPYEERTTKVGEYGENKWGLCDMHGNVWQWCQDWYGPYNDDLQSTDPLRSVKHSEECRVLRGGSWNHGAKNCRAACRNGNAPVYRSNLVGFRVCVGLD